MDSLNQQDQRQLDQPLPVQDAEGHFASLTSGSTASPPQDEIHTPISPTGSYVSSPTVDSTPAFSPTMETDAWPAFRSGSVRSARTMPSSRPMSLRRETRRASKRSGSSSFSPASAFLSKWGRDSLQSVAPDPDDEGQSFGLNNEYVIGRQIGYGGFSVVKEAFSMDEDGNKSKHAVKIVRKNIQEKPDSDNERCQQELEHEVGIWKYLSHEHILGLHAVFDTDFATFCVMDLNEGGSLYDLIRDQRKSDVKSLNAETAKSYAFQLACALRYLHQDARVVHRDVKMENCLIDRDRALLGDKPGKLRLCDFGLADFISSDSPDLGISGARPGNAANVVGSLEYAAPEAMKTEAAVLAPTVDIWAFGVCVYTLVTGDRPFKHSMASKLVDMISHATWDHQAVRDSPTARDHYREILTLLRGCLNPDASKRWTISQVLASPWFGDCDDAYAI
ncbi:kinase-like protein [Myriangium duriaei CBS 260.36]|uniref:Kinase-like protein n=1 Tax=Myriangium duriaei CBS 260.36 TaxID=1168546 RepID=A0A9P4MP79_9PEZI|nr:kinase-like protein [Myriangium duriaei CBS 260.36]